MTHNTRASLSNYWSALHATPRLALHACIYLWAARQTPAGRVLDLGCEYGFGSQLVAQSNPRLQVLAMDPDLAALHYTKHIRFDPQISWVGADACNLPVAAESFSGIYLINLLHLVRDPGRVVFEVKRALKPAGVAILSIIWEEAGEAGTSRSSFIKDLEAEISSMFPQVTYPQKIGGQIPSFTPQSFLIDQPDSTWIAFCRKH